jgi:hypothetical protein
MTATFLFALGIGMVAVHTALAAVATQRTSQRLRTVILVSG